MLFPPNSGDSIGVTCSGCSSTTALSSAIAMWDCCYDASHPTTPHFLGNGSGNFNVTLVIHDENSTIYGGGCGQFSPTKDQAGSVNGGTIDVFTSRKDGSTCIPLDKTIAHELGHVLGLNDSSCNDNHMMAPRSTRWPLGTGG